MEVWPGSLTQVLEWGVGRRGGFGHDRAAHHDSRWPSERREDQTRVGPRVHTVSCKSIWGFPGLPGAPDEGVVIGQIRETGGV